MYNLFNTMPVDNRGIQYPAYLNVLKQNQLKQISNIKKYVRTTNFSVESSHILVRICMDLNLNPNMDLFDYHDRLKDHAEAVGNANGLVSSLRNHASLTRSYFYGGCQEILLYVEEDLDILNIEHNWKNMECIKILMHPINSTSIWIPDGQEIVEQEDVCIIEIDIVKLGMMYYFWYKEIMSIEDIDVRDTIMMFIYQYPLVNAMGSHFDYAIFNRLNALMIGKTTYDFYDIWPIANIDYTKKIDRYLYDRINYLYNRKLPFEHQLVNIFLFNYSTLLELIRLKPMALTRQVIWVLAIARLPIIEFLYELNSNTTSANKEEMSTIRKTIRIMKNDNALRYALDSKVEASIINRFNKLLDK